MRPKRLPNSRSILTFNSETLLSKIFLYVILIRDVNSCKIDFFTNSRSEDTVRLKWFVNTNEDVGGFRLELRSAGIPQTTLFSKEIPYDQREEVIKVSKEFGDDW